MVNATRKPSALNPPGEPIRQKPGGEPPLLQCGSLPRPVLSAAAVYTTKILDALISETDKAMADAMTRGTGYLRFTTSGAQHVPYDDVRIELGAARDAS